MFCKVVAMHMKFLLTIALAACGLPGLVHQAIASEGHGAIADSFVAEQRAALAKATEGAGFGPQSPRDIAITAGNNHRSFGSTPERYEMNLCNIHFHENAEHRGGEFTTYAGNGDGHGYGSGCRYNGSLAKSELAPYNSKIGESEHGDVDLRSV